MPFTPSHAIVALPFIRTPLVPAAIAVGAMAPDLPLFLSRGPVTYQQTHTNIALSSALALVLLLVWYALIRPAVRELSPRALARRLPPEWDATGAELWRDVRAPRPGARAALWRNPLVFFVMVAVSLALGVASHIAWDAFTHVGRWGVRLAPALDRMWGPLVGYKWLQYGSGVVGLVVLAVCGVWWLRRREPSASVVRVLPAAVRIAWWASLPALLAAAWAIGLAEYGSFTASWTAQHLAHTVLPPACAAWGALTLLLALVVIVRRRRLRR